ncbi:MAG: hypothetical protein ACRC5T_04095 [Cetobacterium sp.]
MLHKKYFYSTLLYFLLGIFILVPIVYLVMGLTKPNEDVYEAINAANQKTNYTEVILGDSVSRQLFNIRNQEDSDYYHLSSNQAISVLGNYILLEKYLKNNPQTEKVYLMMRPTSFSNDLNQKWTYAYFILPFFNEENRSMFSKNILEKLKNRNKEIYLNYNLINILEKNPKFALSIKIDYSNNIDHSNNEAFLSDVSVEYLKKIDKLCSDNNIEFKVLSSPLSKKETKVYLNLKKDISENNFDFIFSKYFQSISFYPETSFGDGVHFEKEYLNRNIQNISKKIFSKAQASIPINSK